MKDYPQSGFQKGHGLINGGSLGKHWKAKDTSNYTGENGFKKGDNFKEESFNWKGEDASLNAKHSWIRRNYGYPPYCEDCGKIGEKHNNQWNIDWSNVDHSYRRVREDYNGRCRSCHRKYDIKYNSYKLV